MRLSDASLDDLRARNPVAEVVGRLGIRLRPSGRRLVGPCPICGGDPRHAGRFEVKATDRWACAACSNGGDVIRLIQFAQGMSFRQAVAWLGGADEVDPATAARLARERAEISARRQAQEDARREQERRRLHAMWRAAALIAETPARGYLAGRFIDVPGLRLRAVAELPFYHGEEADGRRRVVHTGPAMLAAIVRPDGRFGGLHITWLHPAFDGRKAEIVDPETGEPLKVKKMRGSVKAGHIELWRPAGPATRLVLGEGIETTASALAAEVGGPAAERTLYWSAGDLGNLGGPAAWNIEHPSTRTPAGYALRVPGDEPDLEAPAIVAPTGIAEAIIIGDGDSDPFTTEAAVTRAARRFVAQGVDARIAWAPKGRDMNDLLRAGA